ncbi:MAG TPA: hypothetical protein VKU41_31255 [Polyangiaceae bacterium]|nr:hypothetical protein [Polyangiaceae bacterium]
MAQRTLLRLAAVAGSLALLGAGGCVPSPSAAVATDASPAPPVEGGADVASDAPADGSPPGADAADAGSPTAATADAGVPADGATQGSPPGDAASADGAQASGADASPPLPACGQIIALSGCKGMTVLQGGDGFVGVGPDGGVGAYDTGGHLLRALGPATLEMGVTSAAQAGGVTAAAVVGGVQDFTYANLVVDTGASILLQNSSVFGHLAPNVGVRDDGRILVVENEIAGADGGQLTQPIPVVRAFDSSAKPLGVVRPTVSSVISAGASVIVTSSHALYILLATPDMSTVNEGMVIAYDANLAETARWSSPMGVVPQSFAQTPGGSIVVVGSQVVANGGTVGWVDELDGTTLAPVWSAPRTIGTVGSGFGLIGVGVVPSGRIFVSGQDTAASLWVQALDPSGVAIWPQRVQTTLAPAMSGGVGPIVLQHDGALLLNGGFELVPCP